MANWGGLKFGVGDVAHGLLNNFTHRRRFFGERPQKRPSGKNNFRLLEAFPKKFPRHTLFFREMENTGARGGYE